MTGIIALSDPKTKRVCLAGDSAGTGSRGEIHIREESKVFLRDGYAIGFTTSFRMGQLLRYVAELPPPPESIPVEELQAFMVTDFVPAVRKTFAEHGFAKTHTESATVGKRQFEESGQATGGQFLVGVQGTIFHVGDDFQVGRPMLHYAAIGSGARIALGALTVLPARLPMKERARKALEASALHTSGVRPPFNFIEL